MFFLFRYVYSLTVEKRTDHIYGFLDPIAIQTVGNKSNDISAYLLEAFTTGDKDIYLAPYLQR